MKLFAAVFVAIRATEEPKFLVNKSCEDATSELTEMNPIENGWWDCKTTSNGRNRNCVGKCNGGKWAYFIAPSGEKPKIQANCANYAPKTNIITTGLDEPPVCKNDFKTCRETLDEIEKTIENASFGGVGWKNRLQCDDGRYVERYGCKKGGKVYKRWGIYNTDQPCKNLCYYKDVDVLFPLENGTWRCDGPGYKYHQNRKQTRTCKASCSGDRIFMRQGVTISKKNSKLILLLVI